MKTTRLKTFGIAAALLLAAMLPAGATQVGSPVPRGSVTNPVILWSATANNGLGGWTVVGAYTEFGSRSANTVLAGPISGAATTPAFRPLVSADLPATISPTVINLGTAGVISNTQTGVGVFDFLYNSNGLEVNASGTTTDVNPYPYSRSLRFYGGSTQGLVFRTSTLVGGEQASGEVPLTVKLSPGQTADALQANTATGGNIFRVTAAGAVTAASTINAVGGFLSGGAAGISVTVPLAKLTTGGAQGSLTVTSGIITGYLAPT